MEYTQFGKTRCYCKQDWVWWCRRRIKNYLAEYDPESEEARKNVYAALELAVEKGITYTIQPPAMETVFQKGSLGMYYPG